MGEHVCCICGRTFIGWGNDPWPVNKEDEATCCDDCNLTVVVPARWAEAFDKEENNEDVRD